jgi:hypothetical protein
MSAADLIARIRREGGRVWLDRQGRLRAKGVSDARLKQLRESPYLVIALLREEASSLRREHSGDDPQWWRQPEEAWTYPEQWLKPFPEIVRIWAAAHCVGAACCASNPRILCREFSVWAGFERDAAAEREFLQQLCALGFHLHEGMVEGICLAEDFEAALEYEVRSPRGRCDEGDSRKGSARASVNA